MRDARARIAGGVAPGITSFVTLTMPGSIDPARSFDLLPDAFKRLQQRMQRRYGRIEWVGVVEVQPRRRAAHLHLLVRGPRVGARWLASAAADSGFGRVADVRAAGLHHVNYMVKALGVDATSRLPAFTRRIRWSGAWIGRTVARRSGRQRTWYLADASPAAAALSAEIRGYRVATVAQDRPSRPSWRPVRWFPAGTFARSPTVAYRALVAA